MKRKEKEKDRQRLTLATANERNIKTYINRTETKSILGRGV